MIIEGSLAGNTSFSPDSCLKAADEDVEEKEVRSCLGSFGSAVRRLDSLVNFGAFLGFSGIFVSIAEGYGLYGLLVVVEVVIALEDGLKLLNCEIPGNIGRFNNDGDDAVGIVS